MVCCSTGTPLFKTNKQVSKNKNKTPWFKIINASLFGKKENKNACDSVFILLSISSLSATLEFYIIIILCFVRLLIP